MSAKRVSSRALLAQLESTALRSKPSSGPTFVEAVVTDQPQQTKVSDYIVSRLPDLTGSRHVFLLSGGGMMHLLDSVGRGPAIPFSLHHEQAVAIAAYAYGRTINSVGVCFVTSGPGGTNALTGVAAAYTDSAPMLVISGNVSTLFSLRGHGLRQRGLQELNIVDVVKPITKYAAYVDDKTRIRYELEKAVYFARSGRPGPVWLDIPLDIQAAKVNAAELVGFDQAELREDSNPAPDSGSILTIIERFKKAKRPLLLLGHGVWLSGAKDKARALLERLRVPVQTTWNAIDLIPEAHPLYFGRANAFGPRYANFIIQNADYILSIGARLSVQHTGYNVEAFAREAHVDMVDLDESEAKKPFLKIGNFMRFDAAKTIDALYKATNGTICEAPKEWLDYCQRMKQSYPVAPSLEKIKDEKYVDPYYFVDVLSELLPEDALVPFGSSGTCYTVSGQVFKPKSGQRVFPGKGMASMGFGLPSAIGASLALDGKRAITIIGDGGLQLNIQELQTVAHHRMPIKIFVISNEGYYAIRVTQETYFENFYVASSTSSGVSIPDLRKIAEAYGLVYSRISVNEEVREGIRRTLSSDVPELIEVMVDPAKPLLPKLSSYIKPDGTMSSRPLEDLAPLLDREEFRRNMFTKPVT
jgi:acetolactate synthase-1/2/3 large subunit